MSGVICGKSAVNIGSSYSSSLCNGIDGYFLYMYGIFLALCIQHQSSSYSSAGHLAFPDHVLVNIYIIHLDLLLRTVILVRKFDGVCYIQYIKIVLPCYTAIQVMNMTCLHWVEERLR